MIDRRGLMTGGAAALAAASVAGKAMAAAQVAPQVASKGFLWGSAGAAYQIEGGNFASDLWILEHMKPSIFAVRSIHCAGPSSSIYTPIGVSSSVA